MANDQTVPDTQKHPFSADRPIASWKEDLLGRSGFAQSLASAIRGWKGNDSLVIALYGPWGSGKSSVKNMVLESLRETKKDCPLIVEFNPWQWAGQEQLAEAFFQEVGVALGKSNTSEKGKKRAAKWRAYGTYLTLGASVARSLKTVFPLLGIPGSTILDILAKGMEQSSKATQEGFDALDAQAEAIDRNLSDLKQDLSNVLKALKRPILVIMDDVDRLSTDEIKLLFQLVKANADFPNLIYLLLFQRDVVEKSLETIAPLNGKEFLEKIVQFGVNIPRVERSRLEQVLLADLTRLLGDETVGQRFDQQRWDNIFIPGLRPYFTNLRNVHRFLATLSFHITLFRNNGSFEVNPIDLVALEVLRVFEPEVYLRLPEAKAALTEWHDSTLFTRQAAADAARGVVESVVDQTPEADRSQVREILKELFPFSRKMLGGFAYGPGFEEEWLRDLRVCHPYVFDRYFHFAIPAGDISQAELDRILSITGDRESFVAELVALSGRNLLIVALDRLEAYKEKIDLQHAVPFITALFDIGENLPRESTLSFSYRPSMHVVRIVYGYLEQEADLKKRGQILKEAMNASPGLYLPVYQTSWADVGQQNSDASIVAEDDLKELQKICVEKIEQAAQSGILRIHPNMAYILNHWCKWTSSEEPKNWVETLISSTEGLLSFLTAFLSPYISYVEADRGNPMLWRSILDQFANLVSVDILEKKFEQFSLVSLEDKERQIVQVFQKALKYGRRPSEDPQNQQQS